MNEKQILLLDNDQKSHCSAKILFTYSTFFFVWLANKMPTMIFKPLSQYLLSQRRYKSGTEDLAEDCDVNSVPVPRKQLHRRKALY